MPTDTIRIIAETIARTPDWLRRDLASDDAKLREQAEETLALMLTSALDKTAHGPDD